MFHLEMSAVTDLASRVLVLVTIAFVSWVWLLMLFRRLEPPIGGLLAALLSWVLASVSVPWLINALQQHHAWPLV
jgi:hypothetical protein